MDEQKRKEYWSKNISTVLWLLAIWFLVGYVLPIFFVDSLNSIRLGGFKLGFWVAQQGSIYTFIVLIFVYVRMMNKLDKKYGVQE